MEGVIEIESVFSLLLIVFKLFVTALVCEFVPAVSIVTVILLRVAVIESEMSVSVEVDGLLLSADVSDSVSNVVLDVSSSSFVLSGEIEKVWGTIVVVKSSSTSDRVASVVKKDCINVLVENELIKSVNVWLDV